MRVILFLMKSILLSTIKVLIIHLVILFSLSILGAILYMIFTMSSTLVAGRGFTAFNLSFFIQGFFLSLPFIFSLSAAFIAFYAIRNKEIPTIALIIFSVFYMALWIFGQPIIIKKGIQQASKTSYIINKNPLSPGYFRHVNDRYIFFYSSVDEENVASGICMDKNENSNNVYTFKDVRLADSNSNFTDSLIQSSIDMPPIIKIVIKEIHKYISVITFECSGKKEAWFIFSSLGLALVSLVFMRGFSNWRFINMISIFSLSVILVILNIDILSYGKLYFMTERINSYFTFAPTNSNSFLFLLNIFLAAIFIILGLIWTTKNRNNEIFESSDFGDD